MTIKIKAIIALGYLLALSNISTAQIDTTKVGIYVMSVYDLDYESSSFSFDYWIWRINNKREYKNDYLFLTSNSKAKNKLRSNIDFRDQSENQIPKNDRDTIFWDYERYQEIIKHNYDISEYPFDTENLEIEFETDTYHDDVVKLLVDEESGHTELKMNGWRIGKMQIERVNKTYNSNFGSPGDRGGHTYSGFKVTIPIQREGTALFFKLFTGLFVAFIIALFSLRINIAEADGRFGVCVGALFAALANMYIVNSNLPVASSFTFMDKAHVLVIILILTLFIASTFSLQYYKTEKLAKSKKLDKIVIYSVIVVFCIGMLVIWPY